MPKHRFTITFETNTPDNFYPGDLDAEGRLALDLQNFSED